jgi:hypothetical protein
MNPRRPLRTPSMSDYEMLVQVIRTENAPILQRLETIEHTLQQTYTKDLMDAKLKEVTDDITDLKAGLAEFKKQLGDAWQQVGVKLGVVFSILYIASQVIHFH